MSATQTLIEHYQRATPSTRRRGRSWYPQVNRILTSLARQNDRTVAQAVAVFAITSMDTQLLLNLRFTEGVLKGERSAGCYPLFQAPLIARALETTRPGRHVRGPKCIPFYKAIMGDTNALVLDRWAFRAAGVTQRGPGVRVRREIEQAYREAAATCGETVRAFQAIVWIHTRESTPSANGTVPRQRRRGLPDPPRGVRAERA